MNKHLILLMGSLLATSSLQGAITDQTDWKANDWASGYFDPFIEENTGNNSSLAAANGYTFPTASGNRYMLITWKESEYDGSRNQRGHEFKSDVLTNWESYAGWRWYFPNSTNNFISATKTTILWQMYCWNSAGCNNWTAHLSLEKDDLYISYRSACVTATKQLVKSNLTKKRWYGLACLVRPGDGNGRFIARIDSSTVLDQKNISVGFGSKNSDGSMIDAVMGVKMGIYAADTQNYSNNETRRLRLDDASFTDRDGGIKGSAAWARVEPW